LLSYFHLKATWYASDPAIQTCKNLSLVPDRAGIFCSKTWVASNWEIAASTYEEEVAHKRETSFLGNLCRPAASLTIAN